MTSIDYQWDDLHHQSYYLPMVTDEIFPTSDQFTLETKDFIPSCHIDWFQNPIQAPNAFEEGNMAKISPTIPINISLTSSVIENISVGASYSPTEITNLKHLFQEVRDIFAWAYTKMPNLDPTIMEHHIDTWLDAPSIREN